MNLSRTPNLARRLPKRRPAVASITLVAGLLLLGAPAVPGRADCDDCPCQGSIWCASGTCWLSGTFCVRTVTIGPGATLNFSGELTICGWDGLTCAGTLNIAADSDVFLCGGGSHSIGGTVNLQGSGSTMAFEGCSGLVGAGEVAGQHDSAQITIASGATLTSCLSTTGITGALQITGQGTFVNQGIVDANASGVLLLAVDNVQSSTADRRWRSTNAKAELDFSAGSYTSMAGGFYITAGQIEVNTTALTTTARLDMTGGTVDVNADLTMGSDLGYKYVSMTGGTIDVAPGVTFTHH